MPYWFEVNELESKTYTHTLKDEVGAPVPLAQIASLQLTLYDIATGSIINTRTAQNVLNANNVTYHATSGLLTWSVQPADNVIISPGRLTVEAHRAMFAYVMADGKRKNVEIEIRVANLTKLS